MVELTAILGLGVIALYLNCKNEVLEKDNNRLRDTIKYNNEWFKIDKKTSIELAIANERYRVSHEQFGKQCKYFKERVDKL